MLATAGSVLAAMIAIHMGQRKNRGGDRHAMTGAIMRRNNAVNAFAAGALPLGAKQSSKVSEVEMKTPFTIDVGPDGLEAAPSYDMA